uniref:Uncharacterized protein n=1 Tax=Rhizophora mucronata TaxID=61149 RepID=A0A2P2N488_RHIMU
MYRSLKRIYSLLKGALKELSCERTSLL